MTETRIEEFLTREICAIETIEFRAAQCLPLCLAACEPVVLSRYKGQFSRLLNSCR